MRLGLRWRGEASPPPPVKVARLEQPSLALAHVMSRLEDAPRPGVLDLGGPVASNLQLYARHGARITFADFFRFYQPSDSHDSVDAGFAKSIPPTTSHTDIILAWDLFNYLSLEEIHRLSECVGDTCAPGAIVFALVHCAGLMPNAPSNHAIVDHETLAIETNGPSSVASPGYSEHALLRALTGLTVKSRFQLRSSMVEYLFARD